MRAPSAPRCARPGRGRSTSPAASSRARGSRIRPAWPPSWRRWRRPASPARFDFPPPPPRSPLNGGSMSTPRPGGPAMARPMVIAIDGPAGAGKSTVTQALARRLGLLFLDTGAMYRAATVALLDAGIARDDAAAVAAFVRARDLDFSAAGEVRLDGAVLPRARIRSPEITAEIWRVADNPECRAHLVALQQRLVAGRDAVVE